MAAEPKDRFLDRVRAALANGSLVKLTLAGYQGPETSLKNLFVRPVTLRGVAQLQFTYRHATRDVTKNLPPDEAVVLLAGLIGADFRNANLFTTARSVQLEFREGRAAKFTETMPAHTQAADTSHDQAKQRLIVPENSPWLHGLGVTTAEGRIAKGMEAKFRQINKFIELLQPLLVEADGQRAAGILPAVVNSSSVGETPAARCLRLVDMGCGKGYLTFAAYDWLRRSDWPQANVRGIDARAELVELCNRVAHESGCEGLTFEAGTIGSATLERVDALIALHACDTATDDAIAKGIQAGASLIVVAPCCHKEVRPQLRAPAALAGTLRHGILRERQAEFVTDALRAALLEWAGYDTRVFEFISTEHTAKNLMIAAVKRKQAGDREELERRAKELARFYGVTKHRLAENLGVRLK